jgi:hypothetical protein
MYGVSREEAVLRHRADCNDRTISSQLETRAILQLELVRLLDQLKLGQATAPDLGAAEPAKRKRSLAVEAVSTSTITEDEVPERGSPPRSSASPSAGYATPTETRPSGFTSASDKRCEPGRALAITQLRQRQLSSLDVLCQVDESEGLFDDHVIVGEPIDRSMSCALDCDLHDGHAVSSYNAREQGHPVYDDDGDAVYRSLPLGFIGLASCAREGTEPFADADHVANLGALSLHEQALQPAVATSAYPPDLCLDFAQLLGEAEALRAELAGSTALSDARLDAMLGSVRALTAFLAGR